MNVVAVLQARVSSSRLPGKILRPILGRPMLALQIERIQRSRRIDKLVVATSTDDSDHPLVDLCRTAAVDLFRGSLKDVLDRVYWAAAGEAAHVVRLTGDCPLTDPGVIDEVVRIHLESESDYTSNALQPTFPDGLDAEVVRFACLEDAWKNARLGSEREHVTPYLYNHPQQFRIRAVTAPLNRSHLRWTVDEGPDFEFVTQIFEALYPANPTFTSEDVFCLLQNRPELLSINSHLRRNEGYETSVQRDSILQQRQGDRK